MDAHRGAGCAKAERDLGAARDGVDRDVTLEREGSGGAESESDGEPGTGRKGDECYWRGVVSGWRVTRG